MTAREISWLREAYNLAYNYKRSEGIRDLVDSTFIYNNRSVFFYIETLIRFSPRYFRYYQQIFQREVGYFYNRQVRQTWKDILPTRIWAFFDRCEADGGEFARVRQTISSPASALGLYNENEHQQITQIDNLSNGQQKVDLLNALLPKISKTGGGGGKAGKLEIETKETEAKPITPEQTPKKPTTPEETVEYLKSIKPTTPQKPRTPEETVAYLRSIQESAQKREENQAPSIQLPREISQRVSQEPQVQSFVKDLSSQGQITARRGGIQAARGLGSLARGIGSGLFNLGGGVGSKFGGFAAQAGIRGLALLAGGLGLGGGAVILISIVAVVLLLFVMPIVLNQLESSSLLPPFPGKGYDVTYAAPTGGNIAQCQFTRAGFSTPIRSQRLVSIFQEVSAKSGVPASVIASVAMHENSDFTSNALDSHDAFNNIGFTTECSPHFATSSTGALGLMQVQPPLNIKPNAHPGAYSLDGISRGLQMLGRDLSSLTLADFCDVRTSVYLGAGVLLSKNGGKTPTTPDEVQKAVCGYFGGDPSTPNYCTYQGSYHYGREARKDFESCKPTTPSPITPGPIGFSMSCPLSKARITCGTAANPINNCGHGGLHYAQICDPTYYVCVGTKYSDALYHSIDVTSNGNRVTLPYINGNEVIEWTRVPDEPIPIGGGTWGYKLTYQATYKDKRLLLDLTHISNQVNPSKVLRSGEEVGTFFGVGHLHTAFSVDGRWVEPVQEANMCSG